MRIPNFFVRSLFNSAFNVRNSIPGRWFVPVGRASSLSGLVFFSSESNLSRTSQRAQVPDSGNSRDDDDVSSEELKRRIERFLDNGDEDAMPAIFEAILKRKLSGKHEESDSELMEEIREKYPVNEREMEDDDDWDGETDGPKDKNESGSD